jgi:hypothetical protein
VDSGSSLSNALGGKKLSTVSASGGGLGAGDAIEGGKALFIIDDSRLRAVRKEGDEPADDVEEGSALGRAVGACPG